MNSKMQISAIRDFAVEPIGQSTRAATWVEIDHLNSPKSDIKTRLSSARSHIKEWESNIPKLDADASALTSRLGEFTKVTNILREEKNTLLDDPVDIAKSAVVAGMLSLEEFASNIKKAELAKDLIGPLRSEVNAATNAVHDAKIAASRDVAEIAALREGLQNSRTPVQPGR